VNEGAQKGILEGILCVFMISGDAMRIPDKPSRVRLAQCGEGFRLPCFAAATKASSHIVDSSGIASR